MHKMSVLKHQGKSDEKGNSSNHEKRDACTKAELVW